MLTTDPIAFEFAPLLESLARAQERVVFVAPYIKADAFGVLESRVRPGVELDVVTSWSAADIAAGVSDLAIFEACLARGGARLWLCQNLHAKYYRADASVYVGSANLTRRGLGLSWPANIEILVRLQFGPMWAGFESAIFGVSVPATRDIREALRLAAEEIGVMGHSIGGDLFDAGESAAVCFWLPRCRSPENLFNCYKERRELVTDAAWVAAQGDLAVLRLPQGLSKAQFFWAVRAGLMQAFFVSEIDSIIQDSPRFGELRRRFGLKIGAHLGDRDVTDALQTVMRWLVTYLPDRYRIAVYSFTEHLEPIEPKIGGD